MQTEDFKDFQELLQGVHEFYGKPCSRFTLDVWWQSLRVYDLAGVRDALGRHCVNPDNGQWMPKPADVVKMIDGSTVDSAMGAWTKVEKAVSAVGTYATVVFDDPLIHRVLSDMGGWPQLGQKSIDEWPFVGKEFQTRYRGYASRNESPEYPPRLIGITDNENSQHGFEMSDPVLVGDFKKAQSVLTKGSTQPLLPINTLRLSAKLPEEEELV